MPFTEIGKAAQSAIYRAGTFGRRPEVPTDGAALEEAARRVMSRRGFAYVAGSAGGEATAGANRGGLRPLAGRAADARRHQLARPRGRPVRAPAAAPLLVAPIGVLSAADADADLAVGPGGRSSSRSPRSSPPRRRGRWRTSRRRSAARGTGTSSTGAATTTSSRAWSAAPRRAGSEAIVVTLDTADLGWRPRDLDLGHLPFARGVGIAQYTSDPVFRRLVRERRRRRAGRARAGAATHPAAVRTLVSMSRNHPGDTRHNLRSPEPRAAVETFLDVFSRPAELGRPAPPARAHAAARRAQGGPAPRRRAPRGRRGGRRHPRVEPRRAAGRRLGRRAGRAARRRRRRARPGPSAGALRQRDPLGRRRRSWRSRWARMPSARAAARVRPGAGGRRGRREVLRHIGPSSTSPWRSPGAAPWPTSRGSASSPPREPQNSPARPADHELSRPIPEPSPSHHFGCGAKVKVPASGRES